MKKLTIFCWWLWIAIAAAIVFFLYRDCQQSIPHRFVQNMMMVLFIVSSLLALATIIGVYLFSKVCKDAKK